MPGLKLKTGASGSFLAGQAFVERVSSFFPSNLLPDPADAPILAQTRLESIDRFAGLQGNKLQFVINFLIAYGDVFFRSDAVQQHVSFHFSQRAVALSGAEATEIEFPHL